jgi:putative DNA primase/helicase
VRVLLTCKREKFVRWSGKTASRSDSILHEDVPTPRWDRFLEEITLGDGELAAYLVRLCSLCLSGLPYHGLFFLWGRGRNGKGVLLRLMMKILGDGVFAVSLRPSEVTANTRMTAIQSKRTFAKFEECDLPLFRRRRQPVESAGAEDSSGGDTLSGAKMRQDDVQFAPTHKLLLPTNDKPDLPADPAFRGRVHFIPFRADYSDVRKQDKRLESDLQVEAAGVLHKLITVCPDVIQNGLRAPRSVNDATHELFEDLDFTKQFIEERIHEGTVILCEPSDMEAAIRQWVGLVVGDGDRRVGQILDGLRAQFNTNGGGQSAGSARGALSRRTDHEGGEVAVDQWTKEIHTILQEKNYYLVSRLETPI